MKWVAIGALASACGTMTAWSVPASAQTAQEDAVVFGKREYVQYVSLSPSGDRLAFISPDDTSGEVLNIVDLKGNYAVHPIMHNGDVKADLERCEWATETRLVCQAGFVEDDAGTLLGFSRMFAIDADGKNLQVLSPHDSVRALGIRQNGGSIIALEASGNPNKIVQSHEYVPERTIGTRLASDKEGLGVDLVDVKNGRRTTLVNPDRDAVGYVADDKGEVRLKIRQPQTSSGYDGDERVFTYRDPGSSAWKRLTSAQVGAQSDHGFRPVAVDAEQNVAYGFDDSDGYEVLKSISLDGSDTMKTVLARPGIDIDELIEIGRQRRVVGASYATEKREVDYFDPKLKALAAALHKALPGQPLVDFAGASADENKLLVVGSSDTDPGMLYRYNKATHELNELLPLRAGLEGRKMGEMRPITFPATDGTAIPGYLTLPPGSSGKNLPAIVLPHGGPSARDEWGFDWLVQFFVARGYAVLQPNYRGSSGYGSAWFGKNGFQAWRTAIGDVDDAGRWMVKKGIANPSKLAIVGWSYGGYAALQSQVVDPDLFKAVVAIAPVTDLQLLRDEARQYTSGSLVDRFIGTGPHVTEGSPARHADRFKSPVMIFQGTLDQNVDVEQAHLMVDKLKSAGKSVSYTEFPGLAHSLADSTARTKMLSQIDAFLGSTLGTAE